MSKKQELVERWDTFLSKIKARCSEVLSQANQGTEMFVPQLLFDTIAITNAWTGIKNQIVELSNKIDDAWDKMDDMFDEAGASNKETEKERAKKEDTKAHIMWEYEKNQILALAKGAKQVLFNVKQHVNENKMHNCTQCGAPLNITIYSFRAKNVKCDACSSVNTYKPDDRVVALEAWVLTPLANEHVIVEKEKEFFLQKKIDYPNTKTVTNVQVQELIEARKSVINKYYQFLIESIGEKSDLFVRQRDERLKWAKNVKY